jgi:hypothetical protein
LTKGERGLAARSGEPGPGGKTSGTVWLKVR